MYKKNLFKKNLVVGIVVLFIGAGAATGINGKINRQDITEKIPDNSSVITNQDMCSLNFHTFDKTEEKQNNINLPIEAANKIYEKLEELKYLIMHKSRSDKTQNLKIEFVDLLDTYGLLPAGLTKNYVLSLLNPSWLKNKQKTTKTKTILSKNYISPIAEKIVNLQQIFKNDFGKTILNIFIKNTITLPSSKTTATASFCSISSGGSGKTLPIFLLPRPRAIAAWTAPDAITMVGELVTAKGFYAGGAQSGSMLGFTGMGLTYSLPGYIVYGFIGYALYTKVSADYIEFVNREPIISDENPPDGDYDVPVSLSKLSFRLSDPAGDLMNYTVTTEPNIGSGSGNNKKNGIYTVSISGLEGYTKYTWHVVVKDEYNTVEKYLTFTTEAVAPVVSNPLPPDKAKYITVDLSQLSINLKDFQGDPMDYTVETSPNIGSSSGNDVGDGTYTCDINGLNYSTEYKWYINVTDGTHWTHKVFSFQTELKMIFNPFEEGWNYRKQITINHNMVAGDLVNFPVLISTVDSDLRDKAQDDGDDILFMDGSGVANRLFHEIELFNGSSSELVAWINIPSLSSSVDTIFYIYYGNPDCINQENVAVAWDSNYIHVWHLGDDLIDSKGNSNGNNHGTSIITGKIGNARDLEKDDSDYIDFGDMAQPGDGALGSITFESWIKPESLGTIVTTKYNADTDKVAYEVVIDSNGKLILYAEPWYGRYTGNYTANNAIMAGNWYYITGVYNLAGTNNNVILFLNGFEIPSTLDSNGDTDYMANVDITDDLGRIMKPTEYGDGIFDEVRWSRVLRSSEWIETTYNTINDPSNFFSVGPEETAP